MFPSISPSNITTKTSTTKEGKIFFNKQSHIIDNFWDDCLTLSNHAQNRDKENKLTSSLILIEKSSHRVKKPFKVPYNDARKQNNITIRNETLRNSYQNKRMLRQICQNLPEVYEEIKGDIVKKKRSKDSLIRCLGLYAYGMEMKKNIQNTYENNLKKKYNEEIAECTWIPITNVRRNKNCHLRSRSTEIHRKSQIPKSNYIRCAESFENSQGSRRKNMAYFKEKEKKEKEEETYHPKLNPPHATKRLYQNNKSLYSDRGNAEFVMRYTKARDEHMIKRFKKLSRKDESYDNSLFDLSKRLCGTEYRNYLNVNNNIPIYGSVVNYTANNSIGKFKGATYRRKQNVKFVGKNKSYVNSCNNSPPKNFYKNNNYVVALRKVLLRDTPEE